MVGQLNKLLTLTGVMKGNIQLVKVYIFRKKFGFSLKKWGKSRKTRRNGSAVGGNTDSESVTLMIKKQKVD